MLARFKPGILFVPALSFFCIGTAVGNTADGWELKKSAEDIRVFTRPVSGSKILEFRAEAEMPVRVASVLAALQDIAAGPRWLHRCLESRVVERLSDKELTFYQVNSLPFPAKSRDAVYRATASFDGDGRVTILMRALPDALPETEHVRIPAAKGSYLLERLGDRSTRVTWTQLVDPGGALPSWIVNSLITETPFRSLRALRELVTESPYRNAVFRRDEDGVPVTLGQAGTRPPPAKAGTALPRGRHHNP